MRKLFLVILVMSYIFLMSCGQDQKSKETDRDHKHTAENSHEHDHEPDKDSHDHESNENGHSHDAEEESHTHESSDHNHSVEQSASDKGHDHNHETHPTQNPVHESHSSNAPYHVTTVKPGPFHEVLRTSGEIMSLPKNESVLVAPVSGVVKLSGNSILPGKMLYKDDIVCWISGESLAEGNLFIKLQKARAGYDQAKRDFERAEKLLKNKLISEKEYLGHKTDYLKAKAEYNSMRTHFSDGAGIVKSRAKGFLKEVYVEEGDYVKTGQKLASVVKEDRLLLKAEVSQRFAYSVNGFVAANFETPDGTMFSTDHLNGEILATGKAIPESSFYIPIYFEIDNSRGLVPGSFAHVYLVGKEHKNVISLPKDAFIEEQGNFFVFKQQNGEFIKAAVKTGSSDGKKIRVLEGIKEGDKVVEHGAYHVKLMQTSSDLPAHGHSH